MLEFSIPTHVWQFTVSACSSADICFLELPMWIAYCTRMLTGKDCVLHTNANRKGQVQMFCFFPTSNVESEKWIDILFMGDWLSEQKNKWEKPHTVNTGGTLGSTRSFCDSSVVIQTLGLEHCAANKYLYLQSVPCVTESAVLLALCLKLYYARYSWEIWP